MQILVQIIIECTMYNPRYNQNKYFLQTDKNESYYKKKQTKTTIGI